LAAHAGGRDLAELEAGLALQQRLEVVRVVVLAVDEDDLLGAARDVDLAVVPEREVARAQPAIGVDRGRGRLGIPEIAARDVLAAIST